MSKPPFDPSKPFEVVRDSGIKPIGGKPPFDPSRPFEVVDSGPQQEPMTLKSISKGLAKNVVRNIADIGKATPAYAGREAFKRTGSPLEGLKTIAKESVRPFFRTGASEQGLNVVPASVMPNIPDREQATGEAKLAGQFIKHPLRTIYERPVDIGMRAAMVLPAIPKVGRLIKTSRANSLDKSIGTSIEKAIRPSVAGKGTFGQAEAYKSNAIDAVKTIAEHKESLSFADEVGRPVKKLPESLAEFSQAIQDTKSAIFKKYNNMQKQATGKGVEINLKELANDVYTASNQEGMALFPDVRKYGISVSERLAKLGTVTPEAAENIIKTYNVKLKAFYKNPTPGTAQRIAVDAAVVNRLRDALDNAITSTEGTGYQTLKNKYASLKTIEKDVNHRMIVDARKNIKGFFDLTDIFSAGDIARGILSLDPTLIAKGAVQTGFKTWFKHINNPNTIIKKMFSNLEKRNSRLNPINPERTQGKEIAPSEPKSGKKWMTILNRMEEDQ